MHRRRIWIHLSLFLKRDITIWVRVVKNEGDCKIEVTVSCIHIDFECLGSGVLNKSMISYVGQ